ncbi:RusA family crossover junction endodeoxyribonuclease [Mycolicibacterium sp.]|uniref:RusA family crossover junction endodeoxyribonuclease n=1 Tax=Mycolicibacterium sp. TaxID=2320850 RepID=UPI0037C7B53A
MSGPWPVTFFAPGKPIPQGSKNLNRHGAMYDQQGKDLDVWRKTVWAYARQAMRRNPAAPAGVPMVCEVEFVMYRPKNLPKRKPTPPATKKPDTDKLQRAIGDAMTGVVFADDSQIVRWMAEKRTAEPGEQMGARITVYPRP